MVTVQLQTEMKQQQSKAMLDRSHAIWLKHDFVTVYTSFRKTQLGSKTKKLIMYHSPPPSGIVLVRELETELFRLIMLTKCKFTH